MVFDTIENAPLYYGLGPRFHRALEWLRSDEPRAMEHGARVDLDGDDLYATCLEVDTLPRAESRLEGHRDYADIQYLAEGRERLGYAPLGAAEPGSDYTPDIQFFDGDWDTLPLRPGNFCIVWPGDLHAPRVADGAPSRVRRIVIKVRLSKA